jgi:murein DD-endopeptidase MepM/ murein hydrolase activator NlpD
VVAVRFGVQTSEITSTEPIPASGFINPDQLLMIPGRLANTTSSEKLIPDSEVVFSPSAANFDVVAFVNSAGGALSRHRSWMKSGGIVSGGDVVLKVATENSINPRLLLSLLEYQSGWVYGEPGSPTLDEYPMGYIDMGNKGLYNQLVWAVNQLSIGYYAYREGRLTEIRFPDGATARLAPDLNAGSAALQYFFAQIYQGQQWLDALNATSGLPAVHGQMFGDMWARAMTVEPLFPPEITQPPFILPFTRDWVWSYTGGPHGAWEHDGAYAALDFAPGSMGPGCLTSFAWVTAAASGLVVRSGNGVVVLDLDGDGSEQTGWVLLYLHVSSDQRVQIGEWADTGDHLGHPSCEGGFSTGTHVHIARKYNGEWIPASGALPFNLGGWIAHAGSEAYKGSLTRDDRTVNACTCSSADTIIRRNPEDP